MYRRHDPARDIFNEKPATDELVAAEGEDAGPAAVLPRGAVIHTTRGDIWVKLFPDECPKTVENFTTHARNGYYDGIIVHRVIKGFMIQTGDPLGTRRKSAYLNVCDKISGCVVLLPLRQVSEHCQVCVLSCSLSGHQALEVH